MSNLCNNKIFSSGLLFATLAVCSCSSENNQQIADNINLEFESTYRYVTENMPVNIDHSDNFSSYKKSNIDAFTSTAYTWHKISLDACELGDSHTSEANKTSYERMANNSSTNENLSKAIQESDRPCLAKIYFNNWTNIHNMLLLSYPKAK